jgi:V/A-type H+-transporting ATPase subunit K
MLDAKKKFKKRTALSLVVLFSVIVMMGLVAVNTSYAQEEAAEEEATEQVAVQEFTESRAEVYKFGLIAAAIAFGFGAIGAGIAIANVGSAAMGAIGEKPEIASQALIFIALAEGLVVFGFIAALMILGKF